MTASKNARIQHGREYAALLDQWIRSRATTNESDPIGDLYQLLVMRGRHKVVTAPQQPPRKC